MNDQRVKISYRKIAANLLILSVLYVVSLIVLIVILGTALTATYNILTPFIKPGTVVLIVLLQFLLSLIILFFSLGALSAWMNDAFIKKGRIVLSIGVLTGLSVNLLPWLISLTFVIIMYHFGISHIFYNSGFWIYFLMLCLILSFFSAPFMALGSDFHLRSTMNANLSKGVKRIPKYAIGTAITSALILLLPIAIVFLLYSQGTIAHLGIAQFSTSRLDNNTISITFNGYKPEHHYANAIISAVGEDWAMPYVIDTSKSYDIQIFINGKDASNASAIVESGLNASINPSNGLSLAEGSSVTIAGSDIEPINTGYWNRGTGLDIFFNRKDERQAVYDELVK